MEAWLRDEDALSRRAELARGRGGRLHSLEAALAPEPRSVEVSAAVRCRARILAQRHTRGNPIERRRNRCAHVVAAGDRPFVDDQHAAGGVQMSAHAPRRSPAVAAGSVVQPD